MKKYSSIVGILLFALVVPALGDEVVMKNGDKITGKVTKADSGKLTVETMLLGTVTVDMANVKTFSTDAPIELKMKDGSLVKDSVTGAADGTIETKGVGDVKGQSVSLTNIDKINPPPVQWTGAITFGAIASRGNTQSDAVNLNFDATRRSDDDRLTFAAGYFLSRQADHSNGKLSSGATTTTTDNWFLLGKYDYFFTKKFYGYGLAKVERDRKANLDLRLSPGVGVGYQWIESADLNFRTEAGASWVYEKYNNVPTPPVTTPPTPPADDTTEHVALRLAYHVDKALNDKVRVFHDLEFLPSIERINDFNVNADAGIRATLYKNMFAEFKAEWKYDSTPAPNSWRNDFRYIASVGWAF